ncbi:YtxH domain-containing protein [Rufibacter radiotolerans]|uniref:YtxH domain-containing protein n=1 Tax=Rufibacter radiotolerans TaxID=1379910 RepID=UPI00069D0BFA|nr:YtxH domain-containing protein [Rufibacter radiotolerans]
MKDNSGKIILALLAGASAGVVAGILMAPETGEATRGSLKKSASKLGQDLESKLQAGMEQLQALSATATSMLGKKGGSGDADVVNTGSNTKATSHLENNPTGGNVEATGGNAGGGNAGRGGKGGEGSSAGA